VVPADSDRVSRARPYSGTCQGRPCVFAYGAVTLYGVTFHSLRLTHDFVTSRPAGRRIKHRPYNPWVTTAAAYHVTQVWALPFSLATTQGVEVSFLSSGYLDVSVHRLATSCPMYSGRGTRALPRVGFPIRKSLDQRLVSTSPGLIAAAHVLLRLSAPRHPPCALILLIRKNTFVLLLWSFQGAGVPVCATRGLNASGTERFRNAPHTRSLKTQQRTRYPIVLDTCRGRRNSRRAGCPRRPIVLTINRSDAYGSKSPRIP
jgi:hypothetical protein